MTPAEIPASQLEEEIRSGADIVVLDVRRAEDFAPWHLDTGSAPLHQVYWQDIVADPSVVTELRADAQPVRVICAQGISSQKAVDALRRQGIDATGVTGGMSAWSRLLRHDEIPGIPGVHLEQFRREGRGCLSYLISSDGDALVVDPAPDIAPYVEFARDHGLTITHVLDTHVHADHLSGMRALCTTTGAVGHVSQGAVARGFRSAGVVAVADGAKLPVGSADVIVRALPGHTTDNVGVLVSDAALIAGDSLFVDSVARPDLEAGDSGAREAAGLLHRTIHERILPLGDAVVLLPCHYPGGRVEGPISATLGAVRDQVALLRLDEADFVDQSLAAMPPRPSNYLDIIAVNLGEDATDDVAGLEVGANNCAATGAEPS